MDAATWLKSFEDPSAQAERRARLNDLASVAHAARSLDELLAEAPARLAACGSGERALLYAADPQVAHLLALSKSGSLVKEIRASREPTNIAGLVFSSKTSVNIKNVYDTAELARVHVRLKFDPRVDAALGMKTRSVIGVPLMNDGEVVGIAQIANRKDEQPFNARDLMNAEEAAQVLAVSLATFLKERAAASARASRKMGKWDRLIETGAITAEALQKALDAAASGDVDPGRYLIEKVGVNRGDVEASLSLHFGVPFYRFAGKETVPPDLKGRLRADFLKKMCAVPVERRGAHLVVVVDNPTDIARTDGLRSIEPDREIAFHVGFKDEIFACIEYTYGQRGDMGLILKELSTDENTGAVDDPTDDDKEGDEQDSVVIKLANQVIIDAYQRGASDIHIEPNGKEQDTIIRFRVDGECIAYQNIPPAFRHPLVARLKIMAKLDISERRKPQDGKIKFRLPDRTIELRVATLPTVNGNEDVVMRILAASKPIPIEEMGMSERNLRELKVVVAKPYGLVLCVGPTGSGKTTTLHSALGYINTVDMKIWTAEDPVEITQMGLRQVQVQPKIGFDFAAAMRAFLRADPDVIMVGEMRDKETASTGIEASLTGHLVLSTLHTNSAPETITRLIDMDIDPFSFADALLGVLAQRLARAICKKCREEFTADKDAFFTIVQAFGEEGVAKRGWKLGQLKLFRSPGCENCGNTGYKGRVALHELLVNNDHIKHAITTRAPVEEIRKLAIEGGMTTLLQDGIEKAVAGRTDIKQVLAVCSK